ncbi:MAG TPA: AvaI/BsoBI family type II restriction endonuclease [Ktedonobacteraceae bacterium]|nr:AvaI/BsoBI family type II restriction endonuclease [Ktedonobacteraceae bacterium]
MLPNVRSSNDLITSRAATRDGFLKQAFTKTHKAAPYISEAHELAHVLEHIEDIDQLSHISNPRVQAALIAAAGFSDKARGWMHDSELEPALAQVLEHIKHNAPEAWREEIVYRFLLTRGDTLGGSIRNVTGAEGGFQLSRAIVAALEAGGIQHTPALSKSNKAKTVSIEWLNRLLVFDRKPVFIANNVDAILLDTSVFMPGTVTLENPSSFLACGELKGGIDPAGADEHWKTANSAFGRIRNIFGNLSMTIPSLFFIGAAIEVAMAQEIFTRLQDGRLTYAANLTVPQQVADLANWLISL